MTGDLWAGSGGLWLTGRPSGPRRHPAGAPAAWLAEQVFTLRALAASPDLPPAMGARADPAALAEVDERIIGERAAILGLRRQGPCNPGGTLRIMAAADGWVAPNLARPEDLQLVPALTRGVVAFAPSSAVHAWESLAAWAGTQPVTEVVDQARLLGLPLAGLDAHGAPLHPEPSASTDASGPHQLRLHPTRPPLVVDLSSLWAGPLAGHLLHLAGAAVVKVESASRPDGARGGPPAFFDLLNAGKRMVALDLTSPAGRSRLAALVCAADVVIDSSRPRVMPQLGIDVDAVVAGGTCWVHLTGYPHDGPWADAPAFGDDAAIGAGLVAWDDGQPLPAGDALADPLAGVSAAVAALTALTAGEARRIRCSLLGVAVHARSAPSTPGTAPLDTTPSPPHARRPAGHAREVGADTSAVLAEVGRR